MMNTERRLSVLEGQLQELTQGDLPVVLTADEWSHWWTQALRLGVSRDNIPTIGSSDAHAAIDSAIAELRAIRNLRDRRIAWLQELAATLPELPLPAQNLDSLRRTADEAHVALAAARKNLVEAEDREAEARRLQRQRLSEHQDFQVLAEVALRHLTERCPVCRQTYDIENTRDRMLALLEQAPDQDGPPTSAQNVAAISERVHTLQNEASDAYQALQDAQRQEVARIHGLDRIRSALADLDIPVPSEGDTTSTIESALDDHRRILNNISSTTAQGETLALALARAGQLARQTELEEEVRQVRSTLDLARNDVANRRRTSDLVSKIINSLRNASSDLVEAELKRLEPLLQRIYSTADPHPEFRVVRLLSRMYRGRGRVLAEISDPLNDHQSDSPNSFLSSSQLNVLAVSVFLALNLGTPTLPLRVAMLDDPLQSLDDLNLLGLIDLLKRIRERRQLMLSTHDHRFASLLERKLRPVSDSQRTVRIDLSGWSGEGPISLQRDVEPDPIPFRIVAA